MEIDPKFWNLSYCGLNCAACEMYLASHGDNDLHEELVTWFQENIDPNIEKISCEGCRGPESECWTPDCYFRQCARKRKFEYCFECPDMPCDKLKEFVSDGMAHHARTVENMKKMKEMGLEKWIASQDEVKFCP